MENKKLPIFAREALQNTKEMLDCVLNNTFGLNYYVLNKIKINELCPPNFSIDVKEYRKEYNEQIGHKIINNFHNPKPCVYFMEIDSCDQNNETILKKYLDFRNKNSRASSSIRKAANIEIGDGKILYVGKSEKPIEGRMSVHFGYYEKGIAGVQLAHWAMDNEADEDKLNLSINIHIFNLTKEFDSLEFLEKMFFYKLKPLIGNR